LSWKKEFIDRITREMTSATVQESLNYKHNINQQIMMCLLAEDEYEYELRVKRLLSLIPESLRDDKFKEELKNAKGIEKIQIPVKFAGVPILNNPKIPVQIEENERYDWEKVFEACINLFDRLHLLLKKVPKEVWMGIKFEDAKKIAARMMMQQNLEKSYPDEVVD